LADIVSKNGNLLLNIGPRPDGSISEIQLDGLHALGRWLKGNGEAIFGTRPWVRPSVKSAEGIDIRFTKKADSLYAILLSRPTGGTVTLPLRASAGALVSCLGAPARLQWSQQNGDLAIQTGELPGEYAWTLKITPAATTT
jgi:alpha-L-fucosidase